MKIRTGFVSNSSSSSFVISVDKTDEIPKASIEMSIDEISKTISTIEELDHYFIEEHGSYHKKYTSVEELFTEDYKDYLREEYIKYKDELESGKMLFMGRCANDDDNPLSAAMYNDMGSIKLSYGKFIKGDE